MAVSSKKKKTNPVCIEINGPNNGQQKSNHFSVVSGIARSDKRDVPIPRKKDARRRRQPDFSGRRQPVSLNNIWV